MRKSFVLVALLVVAGCVLAGCNTMRGVGKDVEAAGRTIQKTADKAD